MSAVGGQRGPQTTIIGIDAATQTNKLGLARGQLRDRSLVVTEVVLGSKVESVVETLASWISGPTLIAIDAPLGWPVPLGRALTGHRAGDELLGEPSVLFRRVTDRFVYAELGKLPLDVGADRIARTAHAALKLLGQLRTRTGLKIPLAWAPGLENAVAAIEVYPAATLKSRSIETVGYKKPDGIAARRGIADAVSTEMTLEVETEYVVATDHGLDAALCVLAGADFLRAQCVEPNEGQLGSAKAEGWIWFRGRTPSP